MAYTSWSLVLVSWVPGPNDVAPVTLLSMLNPLLYDMKCFALSHYENTPLQLQVNFPNVL
jgi:hypothetical protein